MPRIPIIPTLAILATAGPACASDTDIQFHGFASQGYLYTTHNNWNGRTTDGGTMEFNEFALNAIARPVDRLRVGMQIAAYDFVKYGNDKLQLDWAYGEYQLPMPVNWADVSVVAGRFKTGHGLYNDYRDLDVSRGSVFLPISVYSQEFRDFYIAYNGFQLNGTLRAGPVGSFDWSAFVGTQNVDKDEGVIADLFLNSGIGELNKLEAKRADGAYLNWNTPVDGLRFKGSFLHAKDIVADGVGYSLTLPMLPDYHYSDADAVVKNVIPNWYSVILSGELQAGDFTFAAEFLTDYWKLETTISQASNYEPFGPGPSSRPMNGTTYHYGRQHGGYGSVAWQFHPQWQFTTSYGGVLYNDSVDTTTDPEHRGACFSLRFDPVPHWLIKGEFQRNRGLLMLKSVDNPEGMNNYWNVFALKTTFDF